MILVVPDDPKMLRESLCIAQTALNLMGEIGRPHVQRIQNLIDECDRNRPLGPNGKHGNRHTETCGCEDK